MHNNVPHDSGVELATYAAINAYVEADPVHHLGLKKYIAEVLPPRPDNDPSWHDEHDDLAGSIIREHVQGQIEVILPDVPTNLRDLFIALVKAVPAITWRWIGMTYRAAGR